MRVKFSFVNTDCVSAGNKREVKRSIHRGYQGVSKNLYNPAFVPLSWILSFAEIYPAPTLCNCQNWSALLFDSFDHWCPSVFWQLCFSVIAPRLKLEQASATSLAVSATYLLLCVSYIHTVTTFYFLSLAHCLIYIHCVSNLCAPHPTQRALNIPEQAVPLFSGVFSLSVFLFLYYRWFN